MKRILDCHASDFKKMTAKEIRDLVRGVNPAPVAWTTLDEKVYKVWNCEIENGLIDKIKLCDDCICGTILLANSKDGLFVKTGDGVLSIKEIQAPNSKKMNILDYLRGNNIEEGSLLK